MWPINQKVPRGQPFLIYCSSGTIPKWFHEGNIVKTQHQFNSLFLAAAQDHHEGTYTCHGTDLKGKKFSANSIVYIHGL